MTKNRLLIVEDESIIAMELEFRLMDVGYEILDIIPSGKRAIEAAQTLQPELILMDIHLEGEMDGITAAEEIQRQVDIPIIFLTAHTDDHTLERAKTRTPYGYLVKPFQEKELDIAIQMALYKHQMERKLRESEERLRLVIESGNDVVVVTDTKGIITYFHAAEQYHVDSENIIGKTAAAFLPPESAEEWLENILKVAQTGEPISQESALDWNGEELWLNAHMYPLRNAMGEITGVATVARNVTDVKRLKGILPVCAWCGQKIKDEEGDWVRLDMYITTHTDATVSHGMCDDCQKKFTL